MPDFLSALLPALWHGCAVRGRSVGRPIVVHGQSTAIDVEIGSLLTARTRP